MAALGNQLVSKCMPDVMDTDTEAKTETFRSARTDGSGVVDQQQKQYLTKPKLAGPNTIEMRENWSHLFQRPSVPEVEEGIRFTKQVLRVTVQGMAVTIEVKTHFGQKSNFAGDHFDVDHEWTTLSTINMADYFAGWGALSATAPTAGMGPYHTTTTHGPPQATFPVPGLSQPFGHIRGYPGGHHTHQEYGSGAEQYHNRQQQQQQPPPVPRQRAITFNEPREQSSLFVTPEPNHVYPDYHSGPQYQRPIVRSIENEHGPARNTHGGRYASPMQLSVTPAPRNKKGKERARNTRPGSR